MAHCDRCGGYVSRDYARVFGDNRDVVTTCPNCRAGWDDGTEPTEERDGRELTFRMSEFDSNEDGGTDDGNASSDDSATEETDRDGGRLGRVGRAVSGLF